MGWANLLGVTLGNEVNQFAAAPHPVAEEGASVWLTAAVRAELPGNALVIHAVYDAARYDDTQPFGPAHAVEHGDQRIVHSWGLQRRRADPRRARPGVGAARRDTTPGYRAAAGPTREFYRAWLDAAGDGPAHGSS